MTLVQQLEDQIRHAKGDTTELRAKLAALRAAAPLPHACCEQATVSEAAAAYAYAYECPVHGPTRIGSSD